jgi:hypothetical protein
MDYICDEIIFVTKYEKLHIYFKTKVVDGIFCIYIFEVNDIDIHELNLGQFKILEFINRKWSFCNWSMQQIFNCM